LKLVKGRKVVQEHSGRRPTYFTLTPLGLITALAVAEDYRIVHPKYYTMLPLVLEKIKFFEENDRTMLFKRRLNTALLCEAPLLARLMKGLLESTPFEQAPLDARTAIQQGFYVFLEPLAEKTCSPFHRIPYVELEETDSLYKILLERIQYNFYFNFCFGVEGDLEEALTLWNLCKADNELKTYIQQHMPEVEGKVQKIIRAVLENVRAMDFGESSTQEWKKVKWDKEKGQFVEDSEQ
jgi:hypothetical protein